MQNNLIIVTIKLQIFIDSQVKFHLPLRKTKEIKKVRLPVVWMLNYLAMIINILASLSKRNLESHVEFPKDHGKIWETLPLSVTLGNYTFGMHPIFFVRPKIYFFC